jgi:protein HOOK3
LITQYFADVLHQPASALGIPDLQAIAEHQDIPQTLELCRLTLAIAVQGAQNKEVIERIQQLDEEDQRALMHAIEEVRIHPYSVLLMMSLKCISRSWKKSQSMWMLRGKSV